MTDIDEKKQLILAYEEVFANKLGIQVIEKPRLSIWMILIPVIFVYYFYRYQKFNTGRKEFAEHYMKGIRRSLEAASSAIKTGEPPDPVTLAKMSDVPETIRGYQADVYTVLLEHYTDLLQAEGADVESLIRAVYKNRTNFLLFVNRLRQAEKRRNSALKPLLTETLEGVNEIVERIERTSEMLRREMAETIFSGY
jgi:hypothetical protein